MKIIRLKKIKLKIEDKIFIFSIIIVFFSFLLYYLIDLQNIFGIRDYLFSIDSRHFPFPGYAFFFRHWGRNGGFAEIIQFLLLISSVIISSFIAAKNKYKDKKIYLFWLLMAMAFSLMLIEDAGEIRHTFRYYIQLIANETTQKTFGTFFEFIYFFILALIPISAVFLYGNFLRYSKKTRIYIVTGFLFYFLAASLSFLGTFFLAGSNFYDLSGVWFYNISISLADSELLYILEKNDLKDFFSHYIMDSLIEENIEIIGASAFLAASITFLKNKNNKKYDKK